MADVVAVEVLEVVEVVSLEVALIEEALIVVDFLLEGVIVVVTGAEHEGLHHTKSCSKGNYVCTGTSKGQNCPKDFLRCLQEEQFPLLGRSCIFTGDCLWIEELRT